MRGAEPETTVPSPDDGRLLLGAITSCGRGGLQACLAYFDESGWLTQLSHQLESKVRRDRDVLRRALADSAGRYDRCSEPELVLKLLDRMDERLGLRSGPVESVGALEDRCGAIAARAVEAVRARGVENVSSLGDLALHELKQLLNRMTRDDQSADYRDLGTEQQTRYRASVMGFVRSLPEEQQELFIDAAGIPALSDEYLAKAAVAGGIGAGFAAVIGLGGFGAYAFATSALASLAGLFGLTLPFGAYVGLTSTIAVLSNPVTVALSVVTVGLLYRHANRELQSSCVVPMQLAGLVWGAAAMEAEPNRQLQDDTVVLWSRAAADLDAARCSADEAQRRYEAALQDARRAQETQGRAKGNTRHLRTVIVR